MLFAKVIGKDGQVLEVVEFKDPRIEFAISLIEMDNGARVVLESTSPEVVSHEDLAIDPLRYRRIAK